MRELLADRAEVGVADEAAARTQLRAQVGRLERELGTLVGEGFGRVEVACEVAAGSPAPRVLDLGGLERVRDDLVDRIAEARSTLAERSRHEAQNRERLTALLEAPERYPGLAISRHEVGEPGCGGWRSAPRLGVVGRLLGWWQVKVSSGCPLAGRLTAVDQQAEAGGTAAAQGRRPAL